MGQDLDELFDVVDERDRVTGQAARRVVHANGWRHRAVHVLVFDRGGRVFLHQRSMTKDLFPGAWDSSCAGHVGAGEDYDTSAVRELEEELGIGADVATLSRGSSAAMELSRGVVPPLRDRPQMQRLFKLEAQPDTGWEFVWVYRLEHEGPFTLHPDEIERGDWFTPEEVDRWLKLRAGEIAPALALLWPMVSGQVREDGRRRTER